MSSDFDRFVDELNKNVIEEMRRDYSEKVVELFLKPINMGIIEDADGHGKIKGPCGDTMRMTLKINGGRITKTRFWTDGCGASIACGNMLSRMIEGKTLPEARNITSEKLMKSLDGLPVEHQHCASLAVNTMNKCLKNYKK